MLVPTAPAAAGSAGGETTGTTAFAYGLCGAPFRGAGGDRSPEQLAVEDLTDPPCAGPAELAWQDSNGPRTYAGTGINITADVLADLCTGPIVYPEPATNCGASNETPVFSRLQTGLRMKLAGIYVPYDAVQTSNSSGSGCVDDEAASVSPYGATPAYQQFYDILVAVEAAGMEPIIAVTTAANPADPPFPDPTDPPTDPHGNAQYRCGLEGLLTQTASWQQSARWPDAVTQWEAFNEPDVANGYQGTGPRVGCGAAAGVGVAINGAGRAACIWEIAEQVDRALGRSDEIAAGSFNFASAAAPKLTYVKAYVATLQADHAALGVALPFYWAFHPYDDLIDSGGCTAIGATGCGSTNLRNFADYLSGLEPSYEIWLSELADPLDDPSQRGAPNPTDGDPLRQATAAEDFLNLPRASPHVTEELWYELHPFLGDAWDSGLLDAAQRPRASYCVLAFGTPPPVAARTPACADPGAAEDWGDPTDG